MLLLKSNIIFVSLILVACLFRECFTCIGFKLRLHKVQNCNGTNAIILLDEKLKIKVNNECELSVNGFYKTKGFKTAYATFKIIKDFLPVQGEIDLCESLAGLSSIAKEKLKIVGLPDQCPVQEGIIKRNESSGTLSLSQFQGLIPVTLGKATINIFIKHDKGFSCFKIIEEVYRKNN